MNLRTIVVCTCLQLLLVVVAARKNVTRSDKSSVEFFGETKIEDNKRNDHFKRDDVNTRSAPYFREANDNEQLDFVEPWYTNVPMLPIVFASSPTLPDGPCKKQSQRYLRDLRNGTLWATQMYDSSTKYPDGLISGHTQHLGDFDGCYNLRVQLPNYDSINNESDEISGRYCLVDIHYEKKNLPPIKSDERHDFYFDPNDSVWEAIREKGDFRRIKRYILQMALCVPEVCTSSDIEAALQGPMKKFGIEKQLNLNASIKPHFCQALKDSPKFSQGAKIYCLILAGLILLNIICTWYDYTLKDYNENVISTKKDLILCFSLRRNFHTIMAPSTGHRGLQTLHLIRFHYLVITIIGHRMFQYATGPTINGSYIERLYTFKESMIVFGGAQIVEGFFGVGGFLVAYGLLTALDTKKKINFFYVILIRFLRLTPAYMVILFFNALILPHLGSGPYWEWKVGFQRDSCLNNWWAHFMYINNYVNPEMMCMFQTWYVAVDFHLYIMALMVVYLFWRMPRKIGYFFLSLVILGGCAVPFLATYLYNVQPIYKSLLHMRDFRYDPYFSEHYVKTHERIASYFIGVLIGAVIYDHNRAPWRLGKVSSNILFVIFAGVFSFGSEILGHKYLDPNANPTILEAAIHASLHKGAFAIATCSIPALITFGDGLHFHYKFFTPRWAQPLSRLTYSAYLIHTILQFYHVGITRSARTFGLFDMVWDFIPDVVFTFALSLLLTLTVEGPIRTIEKRFIMKREKRNPPNNFHEEAKKIN